MGSSTEDTGSSYATWAATAVRVLLVVAINAVPLWGFEDGGWTPGTILALYWFQTVIAIPLTAALIIVHRRVTHKMGHRSRFLPNFVTVSLVFALAHAVFLALILGLLWRNADGAVNPADVVSGLKITAALMALSFGVDMLQLPGSSFAWIRHRADTVMRRVFVVHMAIVLGMGIAAFSTRDAAAFFIVFLIIKFLADLSGELPEGAADEPPAWLMGVARRLGGIGNEFADAYRQEYAKQKAGMKEAERTLDPESAGRS